MSRALPDSNLSPAFSKSVCSRLRTVYHKQLIYLTLLTVKDYDRRYSGT
jgi:hypothetical protein